MDSVPCGNRKPEMPGLSRFAFAGFTGETQSMHREAGFGCDTMYDGEDVILFRQCPVPFRHIFTRERIEVVRCL